jgi:probable addiction module antidote protein
MENFRNFRELNLSLLREPEDAKVYLHVALEEYQETGDTDALLSVLRDVTEAQGGIMQMAQKINRSRQSLYKALSPKGNPRLDTFLSLLQALGLRLAIEPQQIIMDKKL